MEKFDFDLVESVYFSLWHSFHEENDDESEEDIKEFEVNRTFLALWHLYLNSSGWEEDEFFQELENRVEQCEDCEEEQSQSSKSQVN